MAQAGIQVQLSVREIYARLCPKCQAEVKALVKEKLTEQMVDQVLGVEGPAPPGQDKDQRP